MTQTVLLAAFLIAQPAPPDAGDLIKNFGPAEFERFIAGDLKTTFKKQDAGENVLYTIEGRPFNALFNPRRKFILFQSRVSGLADLKELNAWNEAALYSRAYQDDRVVVLEGATSFATGLSRASLGNLYQNLTDERTRFAKEINIRRAVN